MIPKDIHRRTSPEHTDHSGSKVSQYYDVTIIHDKKSKVKWLSPREHKLAITPHEKAVAEAKGVVFKDDRYDPQLGVYLLPRGGEVASKTIRVLKDESKESKSRVVRR